ncbi:hypothetical protein [Sphingobium boeckii]|uniref:Uncharacterized protein n=1 Tax=Sphingobium boeckii TaxID=1082345 RepID=A0A7W9ECQ1_9SPHN|nr:hypothetical protein [Sphingobium boeckii]MBB5684287.1 hypothetical protein [Sphingobium boeckii]
MSRPDATASAALDADIIRPVFIGFLDIAGDPVRANTSGEDILFTGTGIADLDGFTYDGISANFIDITPVKAAAGGTDSVTARLSGLPVIDADTLNILGDPANYRGRTARLWRIIRNAANVQQGAIQHYYTGYMTALDINAEPGNQMIEITIESYLAAFSQASQRTYLDQTRLDAGDLSPKAMIAIANGNSASPLTGNTRVPGVYIPTNGGGGFYRQNEL